MTHVGRRSSLTGLAALLFFCLVTTGFSQPDQISKEMGYDGQTGRDERLQDAAPGGFAMNPMPCHPPGLPVDVIHSGSGFALLGNESHVLRLNVEALLPLEPMYIRKLLASNKTLSEIRDEIEAKTGETVYRGSIRLDRSIYPLVNLRLLYSSENITELKADVARPGSGPREKETAIAGRIDVTIAPSEGGMIGKGELELEGKGRFNVLLDMQPHMRERCMNRTEKGEGRAESGARRS